MSATRPRSWFGRNKSPSVSGVSASSQTPELLWRMGMQSSMSVPWLIVGEHRCLLGLAKRLSQHLRKLWHGTWLRRQGTLLQKIGCTSSLAHEPIQVGKRNRLVRLLLENL
eukprot:6477310-Amphidinium_carterae.2